MLASQLRVELTTAVGAEEGPALGAAILARVGAGLDPDLDTATRRIVPAAGERMAPEEALVPTYRGLHAQYRTLYPALRGTGLFG
jgi:xylulokinase